MPYYDCSGSQTMNVYLHQGLFQSGPDLVVDRDGNLRARIQTSFFTSSIESFEKDCYQFLIEKRHEEGMYTVDGLTMDSRDVYTVSINDEKNGRLLKLFTVTSHEEIEEFKKKFSDFTGIV